MAEAATLFKPDTRPELATTRVAGRIEDIRAFDTKSGKVFEHTVLLPSADEYSGPSAVSIHHKGKLGAKGDEIDGRCRLAGRRSFTKSIDRETGEEVRKTWVNMHLEWLD